MASFPVRLIFLTLTFFLSGFIQTFAHSAQHATDISGQATIHSSVTGVESFGIESLDCPAHSHGNGKDLCLPVVERAEEQEFESKTFKKIDRGHKENFLSCELQICSLFVINNKLSSLKWCDPSVTTYPKYLKFRNFRS